MVRFLHTADWQLGKRFGQFEDALAGRLTQARVDVVERIRDAARERGIGHVLVAGDVWDVEQPSESSIRQPLAIMGEDPDIRWWLLPGNHDPARAHGLWSRVADIKPDNVELLLDGEPREMEAGVSLLSAPWTSKPAGRGSSTLEKSGQTLAARRLGQIR